MTLLPLKNELELVDLITELFSFLCPTKLKKNLITESGSNQLQEIIVLIMRSLMKLPGLHGALRERN